jgi:hypothetical protein
VEAGWFRDQRSLPGLGYGSVTISDRRRSHAAVKPPLITQPVTTFFSARCLISVAGITM